MFGKRFIKEIRGTVFLDANNDGIRNNSEQVLKDVGIELYSVSDYKAQDNNDEKVQVLREKHILSTKTNERGEFRFLVNEGAYLINLDIETLPVGKGVPETNKHFGLGEAGSADFAVRNVDSVYVYDKPVQISIGQHFVVNPVARDKQGNNLYAKINYFSESRELDFNSKVCRVLPKSLRDISTAIVLDAGNIKWRVPVDIKVPILCSTDKVSLAHRLGLIDEHTKVQYSLHALFDRRKLAEDYHSRIPIKSGTMAVEEIRRYTDRADADKNVAESARQYLAASIPKLDRIHKSPSGYFKIHYTLSGVHGVSVRSRNSWIVPPYIEQIGLAFDQVRSFTCSSRGFREPILEEGKDSYDIYVYDLKGKYGVTYSSKTYNVQSTKARVASSYICIDNTYSSEKGFDKSREDCMKVTAAHEFFHAVQYAYNAEADTWWKEASATWNEDEVYAGINDYVRYIGSYFSAPYKSLDETSYSGVIFAKFLSENHGGYNMIKRIWDIQAAGYDNSISAIDSAIRENHSGKDIGLIFNQFSAYNVNPSQYYKEGAAWKTSLSVQHTYSNYPVNANFGQLNHLSSNYQLFRPNGMLNDKSLRIIVHGAAGAKWGFKLQKKNRNSNFYSTTEIISSANFNRAEIILNNFGETYDDVYLIPANLEKERNGLIYNYSANIK